MRIDPNEYEPDDSDVDDKIIKGIRCYNCRLVRVSTKFRFFESNENPTTWCKQCYEDPLWDTSNRAYLELVRDKIEKKKIRLRLNKYGLNTNEYNEMIAQQNSCCAICHKESKLVIDHSHETGKVRGLLCYSCNTLLGKLYDSPELIRSALKYLEDNE